MCYKGVNEIVFSCDVWTTSTTWILLINLNARKRLRLSYIVISWSHREANFTPYNYLNIISNISTKIAWLKLSFVPLNACKQLKNTTLITPYAIKVTITAVNDGRRAGHVDASGPQHARKRDDRSHQDQRRSLYRRWTRLNCKFVSLRFSLPLLWRTKHPFKFNLLIVLISAPRPPKPHHTYSSSLPKTECLSYAMPLSLLMPFLWLCLWLSQIWTAITIARVFHPHHNVFFQHKPPSLNSIYVFKNY